MKDDSVVAHNNAALTSYDLLRDWTLHTWVIGFGFLMLNILSSPSEFQFSEVLSSYPKLVVTEFKAFYLDLESKNDIQTSVFFLYDMHELIT